ncbi:MAG: glutamine-hydrolyzing carbamoyl-phosphate synthase small subunit [Candidatus Dasytiphilus stammeri]
MITPGLLVLEDGTKFYGDSIGIEGITVGEVVFNTSMTGYQEILTDPSYSHQIVTLTSPHIGNVGTNNIDVESSKIHVRGLIIRNLSFITSNYRNEVNLSDYLKYHSIIALAEIDTRKLTRLLRKNGVQNGCIVIGKNLNKICVAQQALKKARNFPKLKGMDLAKLVSTSKIYTWTKGTFKINNFLNQKKIIHPHPLPFHVVVYDFGVKINILRLLVDKGCYLTVVPAQTPAQKTLKFQPDGIFLSNGPGDPASCRYAIKAIKILLNFEIPLFGICLGHQLLALANGAKTKKMKFGHHGCNHPVKNLDNGKIIITTQNHVFTVDENTLPANLRITHKSLFDGSIQGIQHTNKPAFSFQGHPEASPGPHDATTILDQFIALISKYRLKILQ